MCRSTVAVNPGETIIKDARSEPLPDGPLYLAVKRRILDALSAGAWKPGERLPTEPQLAEHFGVGISTVRAGLADLSAAGILVKRQGKGIYVATHDLRQQQFRFQHIYLNTGEKMSTRREVVSVRKVRAHAETRELLELPDDALDVVEARALLTLDDKPVATMALILPYTLFGGLTRAALERDEENLYSYYQREFGVTVLRMQERVSALVADAQMAKVLGVRPKHPLMMVDRLAYTYGNRPVEIRRRVYEGTRHHYLFTHEELD
jgi:GntR family transcriptional regulator